ncbi:HK97-gp10 family putative phage morphogenesis protein [Brucella intermedia]|uniref:HK97-gp10 family putative phage morphogenesis protein n=1 Tax=Brucella intermedia TaxID=94625 RepID=UPI002448485D|nr:HK97-gp10 family putative phage morphogenesis protein [Brucella intermedia]WGG62521.1 HK97 gp10 family phage protein [Brucella intermedia]
MARSVTVLGLAKLERKIKRLPEVAKETIKAAMAQGADEIVAMMKSLVPVDDGELMDSIAWTWGKKPKYAMTLAAVKSSLAGDLTITIYAGNSKVRYGHLVEFGTAPHIVGGMFKGAQHPGAKASPFFFVSWRANRKKVKSRIRRAVTKAAKQVAAGQ